MQFEGTDAYVAEKDLTVAVNAAIRLERPLLVKGEPGTGKTELAVQIASALGLELIEWSVKSTTKAQQGLYEYDAVSRLRDSQLGDPRVNDVANYIAAANCGSLSPPTGNGAADRRDRQGRHRVSQRPAAGTRPHGVLCLRDRRDDPRQTAADRHHHIEQREGTARRVPAPLLLPLHPFPDMETLQRLSMCIIRASSRTWSAPR
jgi:DNA polymerase III delta prime subunit